MQNNEIAAASPEEQQARAALMAAPLANPVWDLLRRFAPGSWAAGWQSRPFIDGGRFMGCMICNARLTLVVVPEGGHYSVSTFSGKWSAEDHQFCDVVLCDTAAEVAGIVVASDDKYFETEIDYDDDADDYDDDL